ncbi:MAG: hypothetical protein IJ268_14455, partial [Proteobacteria bacterium]|nr:hypothetical protein [Pseudomonadota bacterium]
MAHLLKSTMAEFADIAPEIIASRYIEGQPGVENHSLRIQGLRNERNDPHRNANFFDVIFYALDPTTELPIPIIINIESQTDFDPTYDLRNRGIFYLGCMIADQKDTIFEKSNYDDLRKVSSIWVCTDPPKSYANTIVSYTLDQHNIFGNAPEQPINKLQLIMVHLGTAKDENFTDIFPLLDACLSKSTTKEHQKQTTAQYNVQLEQEDYDMTAGEQIIYKLRREAAQREDNIKREAAQREDNIRREAAQQMENEKKAIAKSMKETN